VRKFYKGSDYRRLREWHNRDIASFFRSHHGFDKHGIFVLDQTHPSRIFNRRRGTTSVPGWSVFVKTRTGHPLGIHRIKKLKVFAPASAERHPQPLWNRLDQGRCADYGRCLNRHHGSDFQKNHRQQACNHVVARCPVSELQNVSKNTRQRTSTTI